MPVKYVCPKCGHTFSEEMLNWQMRRKYCPKCQKKLKVVKELRK